MKDETDFKDGVNFKDCNPNIAAVTVDGYLNVCFASSSWHTPNLLKLLGCKSHG
jgi:hypothetical protein